MSTTTLEISDHTKLPPSPAVSVVLITYKHEKFIEQAIKGILAQKCDFPFEIIIGEDYSPDKTGKIVRAYQHRFPNLIRIITATENVGMHANVDRSILASRGRYIALCDGDDYWHHPRKLQMQYDLMVANPSMTLCHTDYDRLTRVRRRRRFHENHPSQWLAKEDAYLALLHEWTVMTATSMYRSDILHEFNNTEYHNIQWKFYDRNRLLYASLRGKVGYIGISTATYRKVRGSALNSTNNADVNLRLSVEECLNLFLEKHPVAAKDTLDIQAAQKKKLYKEAYFANRIDLVTNVHDWLLKNNYPVGSFHSACMAIMRHKIFFKLIVFIKNFIDSHISSIQP